MTDKEQIPYLIELLDDESSQVREAVAKELAAFGPTLKYELNKTKARLNPVQKGYLGRILEGHKRIWLKHAWSNWLNKPSRKGDFQSEYKRLEHSLSIICEFLNGIDHDFRLEVLLDEIAAAYTATHKDQNSRTLAKFLFKGMRLRGDEEDYYNPQNSNLVYVIRERKGIPISLTSVYMLVGRRLGLKIEGCHFPGHFLARIHRGEKTVFIDCFNGGHMIDEKDLLSIKEETFKGMAKVLYEPTDIQAMVRRFLANLIRSYQVQENKENSRLFIKLFTDMDMHVSSQKVDELTPEDIIRNTGPLFKPGQCVCHARYGYRGIIVDADQGCMASDDWYYSNQTQPNRHQPWYHVLVHGSDQVTYVAENNLSEDRSNKNVSHPLISYFFTKTKEGSYVRNKNTWPETDF